MPKCSVCKTPREMAEMTKPPASMRYVCKPHLSDCLIDLSKKLIEKANEAKFQVKKKAYKENKVSTRKRALKEICHEYIRERDKFDLCICCGEPLGDGFEAGHFQESGNYSSTRYDEDNIHGQRKHCNRHKGGDSGSYEIRLRKKIGDARVDRLHEIKHTVTRYTVDGYRELEAYYKDKLQQLKQQREG